MKKLTLITACVLCTAKLFAQDCSEYMYMKKNNTIETTQFANGKAQGKVVAFVSNVTAANGTTTATVVAENFDQYGKSTGKNNVTYKCTGGALIVDLSASGSQPNMKFTSGSMAYPASMKVGEHFNDFDAKFEMTFGGTTTKASAKYTNRTVADQEKITTPAGTWTCFKITYDVVVTITGANMSPTTMKTTEWYVPNLGVVQYQFGAAMIMKVTSIKG